MRKCMLNNFVFKIILRINLMLKMNAILLLHKSLLIVEEIINYYLINLKS